MPELLVVQFLASRPHWRHLRRGHVMLAFRWGLTSSLLELRISERKVFTSFILAESSENVSGWKVAIDGSLLSAKICWFWNSTIWAVWQSFSKAPKEYAASSTVGSWKYSSDKINVDLWCMQVQLFLLYVSDSPALPATLLKSFMLVASMGQPTKWQLIKKYVFNY